MQSYCKSNGCEQAYHHERYERRRERAYEEGTRKRKVPLTLERKREQGLAYYYRHRGEVSEKAKQRYIDPERREKVLASQRQYNRDHPRRRAATRKKWADKNAIRRAGYSAKRRAVKAGARIESRISFVGILAGFGRYCHICGEAILQLQETGHDAADRRARPTVACGRSISDDVLSRSPGEAGEARGVAASTPHALLGRPAGGLRSSRSARALQVEQPAQESRPPQRRRPRHVEARKQIWARRLAVHGGQVRVRPARAELDRLVSLSARTTDRRREHSRTAQALADVPAAVAWGVHTYSRERRERPVVRDAGYRIGHVGQLYARAQETPMPNRIKLGLAIYGDVTGSWVINWMQFQAQLAAYGRNFRGMTLMEGSCYVHMNCNQIASTALDDDSWDYLLMIQQDQVMPDGLLERVGSYEEPVVGVMTFGRVMENQRPVPGRFDGPDFARLTDDEAELLLDRPGLHPIGAVGMGCTAIRRDVLVDWSEEAGVWFQVPTWKDRSWGEDVWFCYQAGKQGWQVYLDTTMVSEHIGTWRSSDKTFRARRAHDQRMAALQAV